jgi:hypothetical protein
MKEMIVNVYNSLKELVGAPGFEPGASCAQGRRNISWKSFLFSLVFENKRVRKIFGSGTLYRNACRAALSQKCHSDKGWSRWDSIR